MARADNAYSRLVAWLKILLPLAALGVLSTLFLLSHRIDLSQAIPFSQVDIDALIREPRISAPDYTGLTLDGTALSVSAESARPDLTNPGRISAVLLNALFETPDGEKTAVTSEIGMIDQSAGKLTLQGHVSIKTSTGYLMETEQLSAALDQTGLETAGPVVGSGPFGTISAGQMVLTRAPDAKSGYVLVFKNGVKLIYDPKG